DVRGHHLHDAGALLVGVEPGAGEHRQVGARRGQEIAQRLGDGGHAPSPSSAARRRKNSRVTRPGAVAASRVRLNATTTSRPWLSVTCSSLDMSSVSRLPKGKVAM